MDMPYLIILEGFLYIILFGGLSWFRREGLSTQFAVESILITAIFGLPAWFLGVPIDPVFFLIILYIITMRCRLLVDVGNFFGGRRNFDAADRLYRIAQFLRPDRTNQIIIHVNQSTSLIHRGDLDAAIEILKGVLMKKEEGFIGIKYESAAHYNLAVAYLKKKLDGLAVVEFNAVLDTWPASEYGRRARSGLAKIQKSGASGSQEDTHRPVS